jgi:multiple sugar transport system substrate-binding protein
VVVALAAALAAAGCGGSSGSSTGSTNSKPASETKSLKVALIPSPSADAIKKSIPAFEKATGIKVTTTTTEYGTAHQKNLLSIKAKQQAFDVVQFDNTFLAPYAYAGALAPLDGYIKNSKAYDIGDFSPALQNYGKYNGKTYGLVLSTEPFITWYRKDLYAKYNLSAPKTWNDFLANSQKIAAGGSAAGNILGYGPNVSWWWMQLVWSFGGQLYTSDFKPTVNTPQAVQATQFLKAALQTAPKGALSANGDDVTAIFLSKPTGQMVQYSGYASIIFDPKNSKWSNQIATSPVPVGSVNATELAGWNIGIPSDTPNKDAAWKFLEFVLGRARAKIFLGYGAAAIGRTSITKDPALLNQNPYLQLLSLGPQTTVYTYPHLVTWPEFDKATSDQLADILGGKIGVQQGLDKLQVTLGKILSREPKQQ